MPAAESNTGLLDEIESSTECVNRLFEASKSCTDCKTRIAILYRLSEAVNSTIALWIENAQHNARLIEESKNDD